MTTQYTAEQAAELLGVHEVTIRRWCNAGLLAGAHLRNRSRKLGWLIPAATIDEMVRENNGHANGQEAVSAGLGSDQPADSIR